MIADFMTGYMGKTALVGPSVGSEFLPSTTDAQGNPIDPTDSVEGFNARQKTLFDSPYSAATAAQIRRDSAAAARTEGAGDIIAEHQAMVDEQAPPAEAESGREWFSPLGDDSGDLTTPIPPVSSRIRELVSQVPEELVPSVNVAPAPPIPELRTQKGEVDFSGQGWYGGKIQNKIDGKWYGRRDDGYIDYKGGPVDEPPPNTPLDPPYSEDGESWWDTHAGGVTQSGAKGFALGAGVSALLNFMRGKPVSVRRMILMGIFAGAGNALYKHLGGWDGITGADDSGGGTFQKVDAETLGAAPDVRGVGPTTGPVELQGRASGT